MKPKNDLDWIYFREGKIVICPDLGKLFESHQGNLASRIENCRKNMEKELGREVDFSEAQQVFFRNDGAAGVYRESVEQTCGKCKEGYRCEAKEHLASINDSYSTLDRESLNNPLALI